MLDDVKWRHVPGEDREQMMRKMPAFGQLNGTMWYFTTAMHFFPRSVARDRQTVWCRGALVAKLCRFDTNCLHSCANCVCVWQWMYFMDKCRCFILLCSTVPSQIKQAWAHAQVVGIRGREARVIPWQMQLN